MKKHSFDLGLIRWLITYLKPYRIAIFFAVLLLILAKVIEAFVPVYLGRMVNEVLEISKGSSFSLIKVQAVVIFSLILGSSFFEIIVVWLKNWVGQKSLLTLRQDVYGHIKSLPPRFFDQNSVGSLMTRAIHDVDQINQMFAESIVPILGSVILLIGVMVGSFFINPKVALLLWTVTFVIYLFTNYFRIHQRRLFDNIRTIVSKMNGFIQEHLMGVTTVRSFGLHGKVREQFDEINQQHCDTYKETIHYYSLFFAVLDFLQSFFLIGMFVLLVLSAKSTGEFDAGTFFSFSLYALMLFRPLIDLADRYNMLQSAIAAGSRLKKVLSEPIEINKGELLGQIDEIIFDKVYFAYNDEDFVLKDFSLTIKKGETLGVVGLTGAGKTTILNLLLRFYDYQKGSIRINGKELKEYSFESVRKQISVVLQDPEIFSGTIEENLTLGDPLITRDSLEMIMQKLGGETLVKRFPNGLQTALNERGRSLSVGEKQLLALVRAFAHQSSLFFFDEATANIDTKTEEIIQKILHTLLKDRTSVVIAHRLTTIADVDRIIVMENGSIVEEGTREELLKMKGRFEKLYRLQFCK